MLLLIQEFSKKNVSEGNVMLKLIVFFSWLVLCCVLFFSCGGDDEILKEDTLVAKFVSATPPGSEITAHATITVTFDYAPADLTVSVGTVAFAGKTSTITGPFPPGPLALTLTWADGTQVLNYSNIGCHSPL